MTESTTFNYSLGSNKFDNKPVQCQAANFDEFIGVVASDRPTEKGLRFVCSPLGHGYHQNRDKYGDEQAHWRLAKYALERGYLPLDLDGFRSPDIFTKVCQYLETHYDCFIYLTASATPDGHFKIPHLWSFKIPQAGWGNY